MTRRRRPTAARIWLLFGILCVAMGAMPVLVAVGVLDGSERGAQAPRTGVGIGGPIGESVGRTAFGVSAVLLGVIGIWVWTWGIRRLIRSRREQGYSGERKVDSVVDRSGRSP